MGLVLQADCSGGATFAEKIISGLPSGGYSIQADVYVASSTFAAITGASETQTARFIDILDWLDTLNSDGLYLKNVSGTWTAATDLDATPNGAFTADAWHTIRWTWTGISGNQIFWYLDGVQIFNYGALSSDFTTIRLQAGGILPFATAAGEVYVLDNVRAGTVAGGTDLFNDTFESGTFALWDDSGADIVSFSPDAPNSGGGGGGGVVGRVGIAFDDGPLEPAPTWTMIDQLYPNLVSGYDVHSGKQSERDSTDTGTATVYLNDTQGLFDPNNTGSPYFGKLDGKQILLQCWNPVTATWDSQFQGHIDDYGFDINPTLGADGKPIVATIQVDCVDIFDYLGGYELAPGLDGDTPPTGSEGTVFFEDTAGTVDDRIIQALTNAGIDSTRYVVFTGNVSAQETKYDPGDSMLTVLRDAADAELPTIANIYTDKTGRFVFHGRFSRFDPETVEATTTPDIWDFNRWKVGDGTAIIADADRAQIRVLSYSRPRSEIINAALCYPKGIIEADIPNQVYVDATSITNYGNHSWSATDLIIKAGTTTGNTAAVECQKFAELIVKNHKDPRTTIKTITIKALPPTDPRATPTWAALTKAQISDVMNVLVGYPSGFGIDNPDSPGSGEDYYIEGFTLQVRPSGAPIEKGGYDVVECDYDISPAVWSMDTHGVFA